MKYQATFLFLLFPASIFGQEIRNNSSSQSDLALQFYAGPNHTGIRLFNSDGSSESEYSKDWGNENYRKKGGFSTGLMISRLFGNSLSADFGMEFSSRAYQTKNFDLAFGSVFGGNKGFIYSSQDNSGLSSARFIYTFNYVSVPVRLSKAWQFGSLSIAAGLGCSLDYLVQIKELGEFVYQNGDEETRELYGPRPNYRNWNISPMIFGGVQWAASSRIA